jgi:hypothetical protein
MSPDLSLFDMTSLDDDAFALPAILLLSAQACTVAAGLTHFFIVEIITTENLRMIKLSVAATILLWVCTLAGAVYANLPAAIEETNRIVLELENRMAAHQAARERKEEEEQEQEEFDVVRPRPPKTTKMWLRSDGPARRNVARLSDDASRAVEVMEGPLVEIPVPSRLCRQVSFDDCDSN